MPTAAASILSAVETALNAAYSDIPVKVSKRRAGGREQGQGGHALGYPTPSFVISAADAEPIDKVATFEFISVGYVVTVEYLKAAQAKVVGRETEGPPTVVEDEDVREKRDAMRTALFKILAAASVFDARHRSLPVYESTAEGKATVLVSGEEFTFTTRVPRP